MITSHHPAPTATSSLPLHAALPICFVPEPRNSLFRRGKTRPALRRRNPPRRDPRFANGEKRGSRRGGLRRRSAGRVDRKSTRLNSSHTVISYAVFCLKKKILDGIIS